MQDLKLTELMFKSLKQDSKLATAEDWEAAGDYAKLIRFFPHAFNCYRNALELSKTENLAKKVDETLEKLTNVLQFVPKNCKDMVEKFRFNNPLDPSEWLKIINELIKTSRDETNIEAIRFAFGMGIYCAVRSGLDVAPMNKNLIPFLEDEEVDESELKFNKLSLDGVKKIVTIGDNVTLGLQNNWEIKEEETFHQLWRDSFDKNNEIEFVNNAISGAGILDAVLYVGRDVILHKPDLVILNYGINDVWLGPHALLGFEVLLEYIIKFLKLNSIKLLLVGPVPHIPSACPDQQKPNARANTKDLEIEPWNKICKHVALRNKIPFADTCAKFPLIEEHRKKYFANGFNQPNKEGHMLIKAAIEEVIN